MEKIERFIQQMIRYGTILAAIVLAGNLVLIGVTTIARLLGYTIAGTFDVVETYMMIVGAFGIAYCESSGAQAKAEILIDHVSSRTRSCIAIFTSLTTAFYWGVIFYAGWRVLLVKFARGERTDLLGVSIVPSRTLWVASVALICLLLIFRFFHHIKNTVTGHEEGVPHAEKGVSQ